jgi:GDPmannose 4,6-dehydratase
VHWFRGDLTDPHFLKYMVVELQPDEIYNLAALSRPILSWEAPQETAEINALVPQRICDLLVTYRPQCRLFQATSSEIFGDCASEWQDEATPCRPRSPYGIAKLFAHHVIGAYRRRYGLHACSGILFNHESPHRPISFVSQKIAYAAAAVSCGMRDTPALDERGQPILSAGVLSLGDLTVRRDFGFAGDYAEAMHRILAYPTPDDYVVGTGETHSIEEFCQAAFSSVGLDWRAHVSVDSNLMRKIDSHFTRANFAKLREAIGWRPRLSFEELVAGMVKAQVALIQGEDVPSESERSSMTGPNAVVRLA